MAGIRLNNTYVSKECAYTIEITKTNLRQLLVAKHRVRPKRQVVM